MLATFMIWSNLILSYSHEFDPTSDENSLDYEQY